MNKILKMKLLVVMCCMITYSVYGFSQTPQMEGYDISEEAYLKAKECYDVYLKGVEAHEKGDIGRAKNSFTDFLSIKNRPRIIYSVELDLYVRLIAIASQQDDFEAMQEYCKKAVALPSEVSSKPWQFAWIYKNYIFALNMLNKCNEIDELIESGQKYVKLSYTPKEKEYYDILFQEVVSYINRGKLDSAKSKLQIISKINAEHGGNIVDVEIERLQKHIRDYRDPYEDRLKFLDDFFNKSFTFSTIGMLTNPEESTKGLGLLYDYVISYLEHTYFDVLSVNDENFWTKLIVLYGISVNGFGKGTNVIGRNGFSYDYILTCKNFLDWHSARTHKKVINYKQIRDCLESNEVAIEIVPYASEALILKSGYDQPIAVDLDSLLLEDIKLYDSTDPISINQYYKSESPLCKIIESFDAYLKNCDTIYFSASNYMAQFNWGALPYKESTLNDYYNVIQLISTGDIPDYKVNNCIDSYDNVILFGGVDFENNNDVTPCTELLDTLQLWAFHKDVPLDLRKGFKYLPYSLEEVKNIIKLCGKLKIPSSIYVGKDASEKAFRNLVIPEGSILHLSTHSYLMPTYKYDEIKGISDLHSTTRMSTVLSNTGLLLAGANKYLQMPYETTYDGILTAYELTKQNLTNVKLAILSSCSSALGDLSNINGVVYGLASALKSAGAKQILVSLWDVPDYTTSIFMTIFYENLLSGSDSKKALKDTQSKICEMGYSDPYYWASFVILE